MNSTSCYEQAEEMVRSDRRRYAVALALGWGRVLTRAFAIGLVAAPGFFFWLLFLGAEPSTPVVMTLELRVAAVLVFVVAVVLALVLGPSPSARVEEEIERLRKVFLARDLAVDAVQRAAPERAAV
jgi:hypothetical protein